MASAFTILSYNSWKISLPNTQFPLPAQPKHALQALTVEPANWTCSVSYPSFPNSAKTTFSISAVFPSFRELPLIASAFIFRSLCALLDNPGTSAAFAAAMTSPIPPAVAPTHLSERFAPCHMLFPAHFQLCLGFQIYIISSSGIRTRSPVNIITNERPAAVPAPSAHTSWYPGLSVRHNPPCAAHDGFQCARSGVCCCLRRKA